MTVIKPMPLKFGVGYTISDRDMGLLTDEEKSNLSRFRHEKIGVNNNYHATKNWFFYPGEPKYGHRHIVVDGFSPNLNKIFHVGHLRNLAIAVSLSRIILNAKFVSLQGASLGVKMAALDNWKTWTDFLNYKPTVYYDVTMPDDIVDFSYKVGDVEMAADDGGYFWEGPKGPVRVKRTDGRPLYAFYDLSFAKYVGPDYYITGHEQKEHFESLGLGDRHLPMGLVLGTDGKKLKSRTGDAVLAHELMGMIHERIEGDDEATKQKLAWNIVALNCLTASRETNLKFDIESWTKPDQGGLYVSYTYARAGKALHTAEMDDDVQPDSRKDIDVKLLCMGQQYYHAKQLAEEWLDPAPLANYALTLAKAINQAYETEKINEGRPEFIEAFREAVIKLSLSMEKLGMFQIESV